MRKTYSELMKIENYYDRYKYLKLNSTVGEETFGSDRYINQNLYTSRVWRSIRDKIIIRDDALDMGHQDYEINDMIIVHHINPIDATDIEEFMHNIFEDVHYINKVNDPENLICTSSASHNAIHYGDESLLVLPIDERSPNDTKLW